MNIIVIFELSTIDLEGGAPLSSAPEQFLGLWNVNLKHLINIPRTKIRLMALVNRGSTTKIDNTEFKNHAIHQKPTKAYIRE